MTPSVHSPNLLLLPLQAPGLKQFQNQGKPTFAFRREPPSPICFPAGEDPICFPARISSKNTNWALSSYSWTMFYAQLPFPLMTATNVQGFKARGKAFGIVVTTLLSSRLHLIPSPAGKHYELYSVLILSPLYFPFGPILDDRLKEKILKP